MSSNQKEEKELSDSDRDFLISKVQDFMSYLRENLEDFKNEEELMSVLSVYKMMIDMVYSIISMTIAGNKIAKEVKEKISNAKNLDEALEFAGQGMYDVSSIVAKVMESNVKSLYAEAQPSE